MRVVNLAVFVLPAPAAFAQPKPGPLPAPRVAADEDEAFLRRPTADELFRADSEEAFKDRLRRAGEARNLKVVFPPDSPQADAGPAERALPPLLAWYVPTGYCHGPIYFSDGWFGEYPLLHPVFATGRFYAEAGLLPLSLVRRPPWTLECTAPGGCRSEPLAP